MAKSGTFINIFTSFWIVILDFVTTGACAYVAIGVAQGCAVVLTASSCCNITCAFMAAAFVREVAAVIFAVADIHPGNALPVGTLELGGKAGQWRQLPAQLVVVLIAAIPTVIVAIAQLPQRNALVVLALELAGHVTLVVSTY